MAGTTSRVFDAQRQAKLRLEAQTFPELPGLGVPQVALGKPDPTAYAEIVFIIPDVGDDAFIEDVSTCQRDEVFNLVIEFTTATGETDDLAVLDRLEAVTDVIQRAFYDDTTGEYAPLPGAENLEGIESVSSQIFPRMTADGEHFDGTLMGTATVTYRVHYRI